MRAEDIIRFWFKDLEPAQWFKRDEKLDQDIQRRFGKIHERASKGELFTWRTNAQGRLAEIIVLDQFSRNIFRGHPKSFAYDVVALALAQEAVTQGFDKNLEVVERGFMYMPYMHSESLLVHEEAVKLFSQPGLEYNLDYEIQHKKIIERFGRYPHRNQILGRSSTHEELAFLKEPGSSF